MIKKSLLWSFYYILNFCKEAPFNVLLVFIDFLSFFCVTKLILMGMGMMLLMGMGVMFYHEFPQILRVFIIESEREKVEFIVSEIMPQLTIPRRVWDCIEYEMVNRIKKCFGSI